MKEIGCKKHKDINVKLASDKLLQEIVDCEECKNIAIELGEKV